MQKVETECRKLKLNWLPGELHESVGSRQLLLVLSFSVKMKNVQIVVNYKLLKKISFPRVFMFFCFCLFVCRCFFFFFNFGHGYSTSLEKIRRFHWNIPHSTKETKASSTMQNFWLTIKTLIKFNERGKKKHFSFNGESSVIPSLCFLGGFAFEGRIRGDMSILRFFPFFGTNTDNSVFFRTSSFHLQRQKTV